MHFVRKTKKTQSKTLCSLLAASIIFSSIMPTVVLANDEEETTAPVISETTITESTNDVTVDATTETESTETTVDANVTSIPTDETEPETEVTKDVEEPPIEETTTETSAETVETSETSVTSETTKVTEETTNSETTVAETTTTEPTEVTEPEVPEEVTVSENSIQKAQTIDEYFKLIAELPEDYRIIVDTEKDLSEIKVADGVYYDGTYILCFSSDTEKASAINYLNSQGISYALDGELSICGDTTDIVNGELNPNAKIKVAVIDTGSNKANEKYSVLGDNGSDNNGHGTDMCNLILNETNNAYIISIKALNDDGTGQMSDVYAAVQMAEDLGVDYILMSMSIRDNGKYDAFKDLIKNTKAKVFASAGNNSTNASKYLPASIDSVITVGATNDEDVLSFSNYGECVDYYVRNAKSTSEAAAIALGKVIANNIGSLRSIAWRGDNTFIYYLDGSEEYFTTNARHDNVIYVYGGANGNNVLYYSDVFEGYSGSEKTYAMSEMASVYGIQNGNWDYSVFCIEPTRETPYAGDTYHCRDGWGWEYYKGWPGYSDKVTTIGKTLMAVLACAPGSEGYQIMIDWWKANGTSVIKPSLNGFDASKSADPNYKYQNAAMYAIVHLAIAYAWDEEGLTAYSWSNTGAPNSVRSKIESYISYVESNSVYGNSNYSKWWADVYTNSHANGYLNESEYQRVARGGVTISYPPKFCAYKNVSTTNKTLLAGQTYNFELWDQDASKQVATGVATVPANGASTIINWTIRSTGYSYADRYGDYLYLIGGHTYALMETTMSVNGAALATPSGWTKGTLHGKSCFYQTFSVSNGSSSSPTKSITITNYIDQVNIKLKKVSSTPVSGTYYKLNATYKLYASEINANNNASALGTFTCNAEGICNTTVAINRGTWYYFKETQAAQGHNIDNGVWAIIVNGDNGLEAQYKPAGGSWRVIPNVASYDANSNTVTLTVDNTWKTPVVSVTKIADPNCNKLVAGNPCYSLAGTTFDVYYNSDVSKSFAQATKKDTITINANGAANKTLQYGYGDYYFKETKAGKGYLLNTDLYCIRVSVDNNNTESYRSWTSSNNGSSWTEVTGTAKDFVKKNGTVYGLTITNKPVHDPITIQLYKVDSTGQKTTATVTGAVFYLEYYAQDIALNTSVSGITPTVVYQITGIEAGRRKTIQFSDVAQQINGISRVSGDATYFANIYAQDNTARYPLGTYRLYEYSAPTGYEKCNEVFRTRIYADSSNPTGHDSEVRKENAGSYSYFAYTSTSDTLGITNDDNPIIGYYTLTKAVNPTSLPKAGYNFEIYNGADLIATGTSQNDGRVLWTYKLAGLKSADNRTVLTGTTTYKLELAILNAGGQKINYQVRELVKTITYKNTGITFTSICPTGWTDNGTYYSKNVTLTARTTTSENATNDTITNVTESTAVTVTKNDITSEGAKTYNFRLYWYGNGASRDESKKTLVESFTIITNANGVGSAAFTGLPLGWYEIIEVDSAGNPISTNSSAAKSVAYTNATFNGTNGANTVVTVINRKAPTMSTQLVDNNTNTDVASLGSTVKFTDKVTYNGLTAGTYYVTGTIYDKSTNAPLTINGNTITGQASFTIPSKKNSNGVEMQQNGTVNVVYTLDTTGLENKTLVCFEEIRTGSYTGTILMEHKNINDGNQTIYVPRIRTTLLDNNTSAHVAIDGTATLTDTISYSNLPTGKSYTVTGTLMYANGNSTGLTATGTFTPTSTSGTTTITYTVNRSQIDNAKLVSYVDLKFGNTVVASHKNLSDANQTIYLPKVTTQLRSSIGATSHIEAMVNHFDLDDRITYSNLLPNTEYTISGILMNAKTGEPFKDSNGQNITVIDTFKSSATGSGTRTVTFNFDATITDATSLVAFEDIIYTNGNKDIVVARHNDLNDIEQSVFIPNLSTTLYDKDLASSPDTARNYSNITLVDEVKLVNLVVGQKYTLDSTIMVKDTNSVLTQGTTTFTKTTTFTATAKDQTVNIEFTGIDATKLSGKTLVCYETLSFGTYVLVQHNDINDAKQTVHIPEIKTTLISSGTNSHTVPATGTITLTDTVKYTNLIPGKEYTLSGKLVYADGSGDVAGATATRTFTPTSANGSTTMTFTINAKALQGKTIVAFEDLQIGNVKVATHADLTDKDQTVNVPKIGTSLLNNATGIHLAAKNTSITLVDTVDYENLLPGTYTMKGTLYDAKTGNPLKKADGSEITASKEFTVTASTASGTVDIEFTFDSTIYEGAITTVAYEKLFSGNTEIANHEDISDVEQTVYIPDIKTTFYDRNLADDKDTATNAKTVTLVDTVKYENLVPNKEYTLTAEIMIKGTTPTALKDKNGNAVVVTKTFKPSTANGEVDVVFNNVDTTLCEGQTLVCYETLKYDNVTLVIHADINDNDQTVKVPKVRTTLIEVTTNSHVVPSTGSVTLRDTVAFTNLVVGKEYTISGTLMYTDGTSTGVTATKTFKPTTVNGTTTIDFTIDGSAFKNKTIVAFEDLKIGTKTVASHADLTDKDQTVYVPEISTSLVDSKTNDHITERATNVKLVDTVTYKNLVPNLTYTVTGTLYNKNTQEKVTKADGTPVTGSTTFKPTTANGTVKVEFTLDTTNYADETFVAFEVLTYGTTTVATHEEFNDVKQTVYVPDVHTTFYDKDLSTDKDTARSYENITLVDEVVYSNLIPNKEYTLVGTIMVKDTTPYALKDAEGNVITVTKTFKPTTPNGTETIEFTNIDGKLLEGKTTVAFETLIYNGIEIFVHANIDDEEQTVKFPKIRTQLKSVDTDDEVVPTNAEIELEDTVTYENLIVGKEYTIKGTLMFADGTGEVPNVTMTPATFTPTSANGTAVIKFKFNSNVLKNKTLVAFEDLYIGETKVASHADLTDKDQTVYIPEIHTTLLDTKTKEHVSAQGTITVVDTVSCNNLVIGKEYTLNGILMNKKTGEPLKDADGNSITATITWKAEAKDEIKSLEFTFDSSLLVDDDIEKPDANGTGSLVAFEELTHNNITVTTHNDLKDFDQSVYVPSVYTELFDEKFVDATDPAAKSLTRNFSEVNIVDKVYFKNLTPGYTYSLRSGLYIRESSVANMAITDPSDPMYMMMVPFLDANGDQYKTTITFDPEDTAIVKDMKVDPVTGAISGMIEVKYTIDATLLSGKHIVAFETLDLEGASGSMTLVTHADPKNDYETVSIPEIGTKATDKVDGDQMLDGTQTTQTIVDTVSYTGLVPGIEYTVTGKLVVKKDYAEGEELEYVKDAEGKDLVVAVKFTPDATNSTIDAETGSASGTVDVEFTFDASKYAGKYVVAFETLDYKGIEVAVHADINDEGQTVKIPLLIHVKIAKMDGKNIKYVLKNAKIAIYYVAFDDEGNPILDENNNEYQIVKDINGKDCIGVTNKDGFVEFTIMYDEHYKYYAKEIEAPRGYYLNNDYFEIIPTDDRESEGVCLIPIKIYDFIIPPKTGDNMNIGLYTTLALLSAISICGGFYFIHKKKKSEDNT